MLHPSNSYRFLLDCDPGSDHKGWQDCFLRWMVSSLEQKQGMICRYKSKRTECLIRPKQLWNEQDDDVILLDGKKHCFFLSFIYPFITQTYRQRSDGQLDSDIRSSHSFHLKVSICGSANVSCTIILIRLVDIDRPNDRSICLARLQERTLLCVWLIIAAFVLMVASTVPITLVRSKYLRCFRKTRSMIHSLVRNIIDHIWCTSWGF